MGVNEGSSYLPTIIPSQADQGTQSSSSSFFKRILQQNPHQNPLLYLSGISFSDLAAIVKFLYFGEVDIAQGDLETFLIAAKKLEIEGLQNTEEEENSDGDIDLKPLIYNPDVELIDSKFDIKNSYENEFPNSGQFSKHSCEQCGKIFTQVGTLSRHKKTVHGGVKYSCNHCEREYTQSGDLTKHVKTKHSADLRNIISDISVKQSQM